MDKAEYYIILANLKRLLNLKAINESEYAKAIIILNDEFQKS